MHVYVCACVLLHRSLPMLQWGTVFELALALKCLANTCEPPQLLGPV